MSDFYTGPLTRCKPHEDRRGHDQTVPCDFKRPGEAW